MNEEPETPFTLALSGTLLIAAILISGYFAWETSPPSSFEESIGFLLLWVLYGTVSVVIAGLIWAMLVGKKF